MGYEKTYYDRLSAYPIDPMTMHFITNLEANDRSVSSFLEAYNEDVRTFMRTLKSITPGQTRAYLAQKLVDNAIKDFFKGAAGIGPPCSRGCSHCCHIKVDLSSSEGALICDKAMGLKDEIDWARLVFQAGRSEDEFYTSVMGKHNRCVFLSDEGLCRIYEWRPLYCRKHFAAFNPDGCSMDGEKRSNAYIYIMEAQAVINALFLLEADTVSDLASMLLKNKHLITGFSKGHPDGC